MRRVRTSSLAQRNPRRGPVPGGSEQFRLYKILKRQERRVCSLPRHGHDSSNSDHSLDIDPDAEMQKAVALCQAFAADLHLILKEKHKKNMIFSPVGYCLACIMLHKGTCGDSQKELSRALFQTENGEELCSEIVTGLGALLEGIKDVSGSGNYKSGCKLYLDKSHSPRASYVNQMKVIHPGHVECERVDLSKDQWVETAQKINEWAHSAGGRLLGDILTKRSHQGKIILLNPICWEGEWVQPFHPKATTDSKFFLSSKDSVEVAMMRSKPLRNLLYAPLHKLECRGLVLPYKGDHLCFVIFLPNEKSGLAHVESKLESVSPSVYFKQMNTFRKKLAPQTVFKVQLPRFQVDCTLDFEGPLKEVGVESIFQPGKANFSGLSKNAPSELVLSQIVQKVVFSVNETGPAELPDKEAAAISESMEKGDGNPDVIEFIVDRPFYFHLVDSKSDLILLAGVCTNPQQKINCGVKEFLEKYDIQLPTSSEKLKV